MDLELIMLYCVTGLIVLLLFMNSAGVHFITVMSNSMNHISYNASAYTKYWNNKNYSQNQINSFPFARGFRGGDFIIITETKKLSPGDVGIYYKKCNECKKDSISAECRRCTERVIHRFVSQNQTDSTYLFHADNAPVESEEQVEKSNLYAKAKFRIPYISIPFALTSCLFDNQCSMSLCIKKGNCI